jgi:hypothetical protein
VPGPRTGEWTEGIDDCIVADGACDLSAGEFSGVGADMGVQWADGYLDSHAGCTFIVQAAYGSPNDSGVYWRIWKCDGDSWVDVSEEALEPDPDYPATFLDNGWWCKHGDCDETPPWGTPECDPLCTTDEDCPDGCCVDGQCSQALYCHYSASIYWGGDPGDTPGCPSGFSDSGTDGQGRKTCRICQTVADEGVCDDQAWFDSLSVSGGWELDLNSLGVTQTCHPTPGGLCEVDADCCPGDVCVDGACEPASQGLSISAGPGAELKALLKTYLRIETKPGCKCNTRARLMDTNGCQWCLDNLDEIVGWLKEEHERQKVRLPFVPMVAKQLVRLAIRNARKKGTCR